MFFIQSDSFNCRTNSVNIATIQSLGKMLHYGFSMNLVIIILKLVYGKGTTFKKKKKSTVQSVTTEKL